MSEQKKRIIFAVMLGLISVFILSGISYYLFPSQETSSNSSPKLAPMIPGPTPLPTNVPGNLTTTTDVLEPPAPTPGCPA